MKIDDVAERGEAVLAALGEVVVGKGDVLERVLTGILAGGHVLIEDYPGLAKTLIARLFAQALGPRRSSASSSRPTSCRATSPAASCTTSARRRFEFRRGPVFTHLLLADEINRATPKTQAALLEAMQEAQVTVEGESLRARARRSSSSRRRTRSSWRARIRCPRRSSIAS